MNELLPDSRLTTPATVKGAVNRGGVFWAPVFCANCGTTGGHVPEENMTFAFYLCPSCFETWGQIAGTMAVPDEVFFQRVQDEQLEQYGRVLSPEEQVQELGNPESLLSKLARDRKSLTPLGG